MIPEKHMELIKKIRHKTFEDILNWEITANNYTFLVSFPSYSISIRELDDETYTLEITDQNGDTIDEINQKELDFDQLVFRDYFKDIYDGARRKARGAEQAVDALLTALD